MPDSVTTLLNARWIIPVVPSGTCLSNHAVVIRDAHIIGLMPQAAAATTYPAATHVELPHHILTPGFINAHGHAAMTLFRGYADDRELMDWLNNYMWPAEARLVDADFTRVGTTLAIAEMIRSGTTCAVDTYFFPDAAARAYKENFFRAQVCLPVIQFPNAWAGSEEEHINKALAVHDALRDEPLLSTAFAPHAPYTVSDAGFRAIARLSADKKLPVHLHLHETATEVNDAVAQLGSRPFDRMAELGLLGSSLQTVHMTQLTPDEIERLARAGAHVVHCPESNQKLASGFCPVRDLLAAGVNVCLGTDGAASNNNLDMLEEMRSAALLAKGMTGDATAVSAHEALEMATINGALMLGREHDLGSIEVGKLADLTAVDVSDFAFQPMHHPISQLVYSASGHQVSDVWINGKQLLRGGRFTELDAGLLRTEVDQWFQRMRA
ncbi:MAG: TRZ/ATZ family hydrolase [Pseudomonadota bacterium]